MNHRISAIPSWAYGKDHVKPTWLAANYDMATSQRLIRTRSQLGGTADSHLYSAQQLYYLRENAREAERNHPIIGQLVRRFADNVLGSGLVVDPETDDPEWNKAAQQLWEEWCSDPLQCDLSQRRTFDQIERLALISATRDGDAFVFLDNSADSWRVRLIEAEHVTGTSDDPPVALGVRLDPDTGAHQSYYVRKRDIAQEARRRIVTITDSIQGCTEMAVRGDDGLPLAIQVLQDEMRVSANRGVTFLAPVWSRASAYDDLEWAQLVQQQVAACIAVFISSEYPNPLGPESTETYDNFVATLQELTPGLIQRVRPGEKIETLEPKAPTQDSMGQLMHAASEIALQLDMPISLALLNTSNTVFHGYRGELQQARKSFERRQQWIGRNLRGQVYLRKVAEWIESGDLTANPQWRRYRIQGPAWPYVDPKTDAEADEIRLASHATSPRRLHRERGQDWDRVHAEIVEDRAQLIRKACEESDEINSEFPDARVHWRDLANLPAPAGVPVINLGGSDGDPAPPDPSDPPATDSESADG